MANAKKRVSAVAALALVAGLFTAAPALASHDEPFEVVTAYSSDYDYNDDTEMYEWVATQLAGANNYVALSGEDFDADVVYLTVTGGTIVNKVDKSAAGTLSAGNTVLTYASGDLENGGESQVWIGTPTVGTITVKTFARNWTEGVATDTQLQKFTITVIDSTKINVPVASKTVFYAEDVDGNETEDPFLMEAKADYYTSAYVSVKTKDAYDNYTNKKVTATISGVGSVEAHDGTGWTFGKSVTSRLVSDAAEFWVYSDGTSGTSTITFTAGGVTLGTWKVTFYGKVATLTATTKVPHVVDNATTSSVVEVLAVDAAGVAVPNATITVKSSDTTIAPDPSDLTTDADGKATLSVTPVGSKFGSVTYTFTSNSKTATAAVVVTDEVAADVTWAFDKATYAPGEKATVTITVKDKNGVLLGKRSSMQLFNDTLTTSSALTSTLASGGAVNVAAGKATLTFFMPLGTGDFTISGKLDSGSAVATALKGASVSVTAKVVNAELDAVKAEQVKTAAAIAAVQTTITAIQTAISTLVASFTSTLTLLQTKINRIMTKLGIK